MRTQERIIITSFLVRELAFLIEPKPGMDADLYREYCNRQASYQRHVCSPMVMIGRTWTELEYEYAVEAGERAVEGPIGKVTLTFAWEDDGWTPLLESIGAIMPIQITLHDSSRTEQSDGRSQRNLLFVEHTLDDVQITFTEPNVREEFTQVRVFFMSNQHLQEFCQLIEQYAVVMRYPLNSMALLD